MQVEPLKRTPLFNLHIANQGKMVAFAGYEMSVQYSLGVKGEHLHTREKAGLFDVSHMGQLKLIGEKADQFLEALVPVDVIDLPVGKQRYAVFTNENGGILDDLMITRYEEYLYLVVNASRKEQDIAHIQSHLPDDVTLERLDDRALVAIQGPAAVTALQRLAPEVSTMVFMDSQHLEIGGINCFVSRSGYTGEDGFEISIPEKEAERITQLMLDQPEVELAGLGARDSLRLESGLCLYGHDINESTTPIEGGLIWAISKCRRSDGDRAGGFIGDTKILHQIDTKEVSTRRVGLIGNSRAPVREGAELVNEQDDVIGTVTSGTFGPSIGSPIAMALINADYAKLDTEVYAVVRGKKLSMTVRKMPFVEQRYYRG